MQWIREVAFIKLDTHRNYIEKELIIITLHLRYLKIIRNKPSI